MNLRLDRGEISLPKDFKFDIQSNHPFFSNEGTASVPATIPPSQQNRLLLGNPENQHSANRFIRKLPAQLSHSIYTKRCQMVIDSASEKNGISTSLALQESEMYAELQDRKLPDIFRTTRVIKTGSNDPFDLVRSWATSLNGEYILFPVAADAEDATNADSTGSKKIAKTIMNNNTGNSGELSFASGTITVEDESITTHAGYGIVPFMKLHVMLTRMFTYSGYTVDENVFATDPVLSQIVVMHNTIDLMDNTIMAPNTISLRRVCVLECYMVPTITVGEMLEWIRNKFGAFVTVEGRRVSIRLLRDVLRLSADLDLSAYLEEGQTIQHPEPRMLRCSCQHELDGSEPAAETKEDLQARYPSIVNCTSVSQLEGTGLFYVRPLGKFYYRQTTNTALSTALAGTDGFDYYRRKDMETEELSTDDLFIPMIQKNSKYMPFIGDSIRRRLNTKDKETDADQPILICYARNDGSKNYGTLYPFTPAGVEVSALSTCPDLTPEKLAQHFFAEYRDLLVNGTPTISCKLDIPLHVLVNMDTWTPKLLNHSRVLIKSLKYSISESGLTSCDAQLQLLSSFADAEEIPDPSFTSNLHWRRKDTRASYTYPYGNPSERYGEWLVVVDTDGLSDYTGADAPDETPDYPGIKVKTRKRWVKVKHHWGYYNWFLDCGWSEETYTHTYEEYFESYNS